ncbi:MAG TPA: RseA family anti-sigma factor [Woeseiaceae bacterium]|nr:RseA family anti-sigma factor [Woeseiaceae bacterium]
MNDALKMQISAFVDGELPENESELLLRRLSQDAALRSQVDQYLRIGRLIRHEREVPGMNKLRGRIATALGEQPSETQTQAAPASRRLLKPAAGFAVAASVAIVALVGLRQSELPDASGMTEAGALASQSPSEQPVAGYTEPLPEDVLSSRPSDMLTQYYLSHGATSADLGANGILTRLVTLELRQGELAEPAALPDEAQDDAPATERNSEDKRRTVKP